MAVSAAQPRIEFLPSLWSAAEAFTSTDLVTRSEGLNRLIASDAVRSHVLIAYLVFTRLTEPDIELRKRIVEALAGVLLPDGKLSAPEDVVASELTAWLGGMRSRQIWSLLEVAEYDKNSADLVGVLLESCSYAGEHLADILAERRSPLVIRKQAADFIARLGYLDALPTLERLASKLEQRREGREDYGQPITDDDECSLIPMIQGALVVLKAL